MWRNLIHGASLAGPARRSNKGVVLLFTIAVLPLLAVLGVMFATNSSVERSVAASYVAGARARMLAVSGVDTAAARLRAIRGNRAWSSIRDAWYCADAPGVPVTALTKPSYDSGRKAFNYSFSIAAAGTYSAQGDIITLRITDCAACIYVNDRQPTLGRMLDSLGWAVATQDGLPVPADGWGDRLIAARDAEPNRRFRDEDHLRQMLRAQLPQDLADHLVPYLTVWAWTDLNVIAHGTPSEGAMTEAVTAPDFQRDIAGNVVGRAPVNVNTAPVPVLVACIADLQGLEMDLAGYGGWRLVRTPPISRNTALQIARLIVGYRQRADFRTWEEFHAFVDGLGIAGLVTPAQADVIKANANPNTLLNRFHPNREVALRVQKADLTYATTEFTFDAMGYFRVESLARVLAEDGTEVASSRAIATIKAYDATRLTSQEQFEQARVQSGAPQVVSLPEQMLARGGAIDRSKRGAACDGQLVPAPKATDASGGRLLYDLRTGVTDRSRFDMWAPQVEGLTETASVFATSGGRGSDTLAEGLALNSLRRRIAAWNPDFLRSDEGDLEAGTVEWWTKFDRLAPKSERIGFWGFLGRWEVEDIPLVGSIDSIVKHRILGLTVPTDPRTMGTYGANAFGFQGALKVGYNVPSTRPGVWNAFETGTWHHVAVSWRDGFVTNLYIDGVRVLNDDYESGGKRTLRDRNNRLLVGCDVDATSNGTPIPRTAYFIEGIVDGIVATKGKKYDGPSFTPPRRYDSRPAVWRGSVPFRTERPVGVLRSVSYTAYVPRKDARGTPLFPGQGPRVSVKVELPGGSQLEVKDPEESPTDSPGRGVMVGQILANGQRIPLEVSLTATDVAPILDDVTVTWVDSLKFLSFQID